MNLLRFTLCLFVGACSQAILPAADEPVSTVIECQGALDMRSTDTLTTTIFNQNVVVTGTNLKLTCDRLEVVVTRVGDPTATIGKPNKFKSLLATGNVRIIQSDREAACGRAEVLPDDDKIILSENPVVVDRGSQTRTVGSKMTLYRGERRVVVEMPSSTLPPIKDLGFDKNQKPAEPPPPPETSKP